MKQGFRYHCAIAAFMLVFGAFSFAQAQTPSATPVPFVTQLTSSPVGFNSSAGDISADGRFVVFASNGDVATQNRNNADGNFEVFLIDYAQRRIFQITNTKSVANPTPSPSPTPTPSPSPSPSPTATPVPTPEDLTKVKIQIQNGATNSLPIISLQPSLVSGKRSYVIVFSSNAPNPQGFDGTDSTALSADANTEIWVYEVPAVADADLTSGSEVAFVDLSAGTFRQITNTPAFRAPTAGSASAPPFFSDDNREASINDAGDIIAFISTRNLVGTGNTDGNPELFFASRQAANWSSFTFVQGTTTQDAVQGIGRTFQQNPALSANGLVVAFASTANLTGNNDDGNNRGNQEVYMANFTGGALSNVRQVTRTKAATNGSNATVNILPSGRTLSRDGTLIVFESLANDPGANADSSTNKVTYAIFVYNSGGAGTFTQVGPRGADTSGDILRFPAFTDYNALLQPSTLVFASALNFKPDGTLLATADTTGLNPSNQPQLFATALPASASNTFVRLTQNPVGGFGGIRALPSQTRKRIVFSLGGTDLGTGNLDASTEVYLLLSPTVTSESSAVLSFFTGASNFPVAEATPSASPTPTPAPTPTPGTVATGLAAGELSIVRSTGALAPANQSAVGGSETDRSPILPVELGGVSVSVNGAAAGLYFVGSSPNEIFFVMPVSSVTGVATVVVNNNGTVFRGFVQINPAQPDIFTTTNGPLGIAMVCNVTNSTVPGCVTGPFSVTSPDSTGTLVPTVLEIYLTGVRGVAPTETSVTIGTTAIVPTVVRTNTKMFGYDFITITLPSSLAGAGSVPLVVTVTRTGTFASRPADTAPKITIN